MRYSRETLLTAVLVVAALVVGSVVTSRLPQPDPLMDAPFWQPAAPGEVAHLRSASYRVLGVDASREVVTPTDRGSSPGTWLVVRAEVTPHRRTMYVPMADARVVAADGRRFGGYPTLSHACGPLQPGLTATCDLVFEVAPDALAGAHLHIPALARLDIPDDVADLDLGITAERGAELAGPRPAITVAPPTVKGA